MTFFEIEKERGKCIKKFEEDGFKLFRYITVSGTLLEFHKEIPVPDGEPKTEIFIYDVLEKRIVSHHTLDPNKRPFYDNIKKTMTCYNKRTNNITRYNTDDCIKSLDEIEEEREKCIKKFQEEGFTFAGGRTSSCTILEFNKEIPVPGGKSKTEVIIYNVSAREIYDHFVYDPNTNDTLMKYLLTIIPGIV